MAPKRIDRHGEMPPCGVVFVRDLLDRLVRIIGNRRMQQIAGVVELVDTPDLGSGGLAPWGFKSLRPHHRKPTGPPIKGPGRTPQARDQGLVSICRLQKPTPTD